MLGALEPQLGVPQQGSIPDLQQPVLDLEDDAARPLRRFEREAEALAVLRVGREPVDLVELLLARGRLLGAGAGPEAGRRSARAWRSPPAASRSRGPAPARARLLGAPGVPGALEELRAPGLRARALTCRPPPGTSDRVRPGRRRRRATAGASRAIRATRCRGGWWARPAAAGRGRRPARAPTRRASAPHPRTSPATGPGARRGTRGRGASSSPTRASCSRRRAQAAPGLWNTRSGSRHPARRQPSRSRAARAPPRAPAAPCSPRARSRAA